MLGLKKQIFGESGYSTDLKLSSNDLFIFRECINDHWLYNIKRNHPEVHEEAKQLGIQNYHLVSHKMNHEKIWTKGTRVLPQESVAEIKQLSFFSTLRAEFGEFSISDVIDTELHHGEEEIYWRLVRPHVQTDVGCLHKDIWFHGAANSGYGMFPPEVVTVKMWLPLYCQKGKSGLALLGGSHLREWKYNVTIVDGMARPVPEEDLSTVGAKLVPTEPGNAILFNEGILHGGVLNVGSETRVSAEITLVMNRNMSSI